jgi:hypothetical protein
VAVDKQLSALVGNSNPLTSIVATAANKGLWAGFGMPATNVTSPNDHQYYWDCKAFPGCVSSGVTPGDGLLVYCTKSCSTDYGRSPSAGLGSGAWCFGNSQCGTGSCSSTRTDGNAPFRCSARQCVPPCEVAGLDGTCHNSGAPGCSTGQ